MRCSCIYNVVKLLVPTDNFLTQILQIICTRTSFVGAKPDFFK